MNYLDLLREGYKETISFNDDKELGKLEYIGENIFEFTTYESEVINTMAQKCLEVCCAISERRTFEYIEDETGHLWYLLMVNMRFFDGKLDWGSSIRGAWWNLYDEDTFTLESCGLCLEGEQVLELELNKDQWVEFINAMVKFVVEK